MKWITREHVKVDRVACPWLIKKFIDKDAEFLFVPTDQVEAKRLRQRLAPALHRSRGIIWLLSAFFSVDALAGGLVVQSLMALFFHVRFGVPLATLSALFFGANLLSALSLLAAVPLARRFGLLNTMVFTHLPSNVLLALVAFAPTFPIAATLLLVRQTLSQMDVPTRQAYTMPLVEPQERTAAASVTSLARSIGSSISPVFSGLLLQGSLLALGLPFILAGSLKAGYDLTLWSIFRHVHVPEEEDRSRQTPDHAAQSTFPPSQRREQRLGMRGGKTNERDPGEFGRPVLADLTAGMRVRLRSQLHLSMGTGSVHLDMLCL